jgi:caffeoyl-CoA O-methyltransferase
MDNLDTERFAAVDQYIDGLFAPHDDALGAAVQSLSEAEMPHIHVTPNQGKLLHVLALLCGARRILEIGTLSGYSAIWMARALPPDGRLITLEHDAKHASVARQNIARAGLEAQVEVREGVALDLLPRLLDEGAGPFDLIFLDADKETYTDYLRWSLRLARPGTLIVADNVIRKGRVLDDAGDDAGLAGIQQFNAALAAEPALTATIVPTIGAKGYDGLALAVVQQVTPR